MPDAPARERRAFEQFPLGAARHLAPPGFTDRVMARLPPAAPSGAVLRWSSTWTWASAAAAALAVALTAGVLLWQRQGDSSMKVAFELHAPDAKTVELIGSFNGWMAGTCVLEGPDATGEWKTSVELPPGRHEYVFLVDGRERIVDPRVAERRPDGFGQWNSIVER